MNTTTPYERRDFLRTTSAAVGLAALGLGAWRGAGAEGDAPAKLRNRESLDKLMAELDARGRQFLSVPKKDGQFLHLLVKATRARNVLEVGASHGYSALWIGLALEETGGKLITLEILPDRADLARKHIGEAGLAERITVRLGDAHQIVPTLEGPFDFVFLDADKEGQMDYFNKLYPGKLSRGGVIAVHNAIRQREAMRDYLDTISRHPDFDSVILSLTMEDGFSVSYRHRT